MGNGNSDTVTAEIVNDPPKEQAMLPAVVTGSQSAYPAVRDYESIAALNLEPEKRAILTGKSSPETELDILPTGEVYLSHAHIRYRLNEAFGVGNWALQARGNFKLMGTTVIREYALFANGAYVSEAVGEGEYIASNTRMSYASSAEACKSNALMRCCKDLGIGLECWDRRFQDEFKAAWCVKVKVQTDRGVKVFWRRKSANPFDGEIASQDAAPTPPSAKAETDARQAELSEFTFWAMQSWKVGEADALKVLRACKNDLAAAKSYIRDKKGAKNE